MRAFPNPLITRDLMIDVMIAHRKDDQLIAGKYGKTHGGKFKGCAVGCSIHTINRVLGTNRRFGDHDALATVIGVPEDLIRLQDQIFESLPAEDRVFWPERFYQSIPAGSDQSDTPRRISIRILREIVIPVATERWGVLAAVTDVADALQSQDADKIAAARAAAGRAANAACATCATARAAAYAAYAAAHAAEASRVAVVAVRAAGAARAAAWQQIAAIACEEMSRASAPQTQEQNQ